MTLFSVRFSWIRSTRGSEALTSSRCSRHSRWRSRSTVAVSTRAMPGRRDDDDLGLSRLPSGDEACGVDRVGLGVNDPPSRVADGMRAPDRQLHRWYPAQERGARQRLGLGRLYDE